MGVVLELFLCGVKQEPGRGGRNRSICITNSVGCLTGTIVRHNANNNGRDASAFRGSRNHELNIGRIRGSMNGFRLCVVNQIVVTGRKELSSCLVFVVIFFVKVVDSFDKLVAGCGFLDSLEDMWGIL